MIKLQEILDFARQLTDFTEQELDTAITHMLDRRNIRCKCAACQKHMIYCHITEAIEKWEKRSKT